MKSMAVELQFSDGTLPPLHRGLCESPDLDRELILGGQSVDGVETISSFVYGTPDAYEPLLDDQESVRTYDITQDADGFFLYLRQELGPDGTSLRDSLARDTVVVVPPIEVRSDRTMQLTVVGHPDDLRAVSESIPAGISLTIRKLGDGVRTHRPSISERQRTALEVAWEVGYFDVPRNNGIDVVADQLDCAVSTASELLRRGQAQAVSHLLDIDG